MKEVFKPVPGFSQYKISNKGRIISYYERKPRMLKMRVDRNGYRYADLWEHKERYVKSVARLVLLAFVGRPKSGQTVSRHLDGNPLNNYVTNLAWGTPSENEIDKLAHGKDNRGEKHYGHKLTETEVRTIRRLVLGPISQYDLALMFHVSQGTISDIKHRKGWAWLK